MPAKPLSQEQLEDSERFKSAYLLWKLTREGDEFKGTQEEAASLLEISQASFNQYCNGKIPLNLGILVKALATLGINPKYVSPTIYSQMVYIAELIGFVPEIQAPFTSQDPLVSQLPVLVNRSSK